MTVSRARLLGSTGISTDWTLVPKPAPVSLVEFKGGSTWENKPATQILADVNVLFETFKR